MTDIFDPDEAWRPEPHPMQVQAVEVNTDGLTVTILDDNDVSPQVMVVKTVAIRRDALEKDEWDDLMDTLRHWVQLAFGLLREHRNA